MFILCIFSLVIAEKVKIMSRVNQKYILTILSPTEGDYVRMMKESNIANPADQSGFEVNGDKTLLDNNGVLVCNNGLETSVISCLRDSNKQTVFNVIRTGNEVTFKTDNNRCLSIDDYDDALDAFFLKLNDCREGDLRQRFVLASFPKSNIPNTPPAPNPTVVNDVTPPAPTPNDIKGVIPSAPFPNVVDSNGQNNNLNACSNLAPFNNDFTPVTCNSNNLPIITDGSQFGGYFNPFCFDTNKSSSPTSFNSVNKCRKSVQHNDCNNPQLLTSTFSQSY